MPPPSDGGPGEAAADSGGCVPENDPCNGQACGSVVNNCQQQVLCGNGGQCSTPGDVCMSDDSCCTPASCPAGSCYMADSCGVPVGCGCAAGQECVNAACCTPDGTCGGDCLDNCGAYDGACCGGPGDGGPDDEAGCGQTGATCSSDADCCSGTCGPAAMVRIEIGTPDESGVPIDAGTTGLCR